MRKKSKNNPLRTELFRAALVLGLSAVLGFAVNAFSAHPLPIFSEDAAAAPGQPAATPGDANPGRVGLEELMRAWNDSAQTVRVVDVRGEAEYDTGHVPSAIHAPLEAILSHREQLEGSLRGATVIAVMCDSDQCPKAEQAAEALSKYGFKNVRVLAGGWEAYKRSGYQVEEARR